MRTKYKVATAILALTAGLAALPVIVYERENRHLRTERARVSSLIRVGQNIADAQQTLRRNGYGFHGDTPTKFLAYQQLLVVIGDTTPSMLDTLFYVVGGENPLRTESPYVTITASPGGVITEIGG